MLIQQILFCIFLYFKCVLLCLFLCCCCCLMMQETHTQFWHYIHKTCCIQRKGHGTSTAALTALSTYTYSMNLSCTQPLHVSSYLWCKLIKWTSNGWKNGQRIANRNRHYYRNKDAETSDEKNAKQKKNIL